VSLPDVQTPKSQNSPLVVVKDLAASATETAETVSGDAPVATPPAPPSTTVAAHGRRWGKPLVVAITILVLIAGAVGGTLIAMTKSVTITVDGQTRVISTLAGSVRGALEAAGLTAGEHDVLAPALDQPVTDGSAIALNRGRLLTVTIDGSTREIWTTARTVEAALAELGQDSRQLSLSADRSRELPLEGFSLTAATLHTVTLTDGTAAATTLVTPAATVSDLLVGQQIALGAQDTVTPALDTPLADGAAVAITRTVVSTAVENEPIAQPADVSTEDPNLDKGTTTVTVTGSAGTAAVTYQVTTVNGAQTDKVEVGRVTTVEPVATQISVGTKTSLTWVGNQVFFNDTEFGVNWDGLAMCESTHNPKAVNANPSAGLPTYGLFQFDLPTWASVGGSGNPVDATPEEQIMRAKLLYQSRGLEPWACRNAAR
jgi:uncharacterized protein YabE (DUF348 family)